MGGPKGLPRGGEGDALNYPFLWNVSNTACIQDTQLKLLFYCIVIFFLNTFPTQI